MKLSLGIESTAHSFGVGIVSFDGIVLANEKVVFTTEKGGMIPSLVAEHHIKVKEFVLENALKKANKKIGDISLISFSQGPGLAPCLLVGLKFAKELSKKYNIPLIGVNHCIAHLTIGDLVCKTKDPVYLYVSGVNTQVIALAGGKFRIFGETLDLGLGNALDKFARDVGLGFPGGPKVEELAKKGKYLNLPYVVKGMDTSFSGIITKAELLFSKGEKLEDICFSLQETFFAMLAEVSERAMAHTGKDELLLIGGVAANKRFSEMLNIMCGERNAVFRAVPLEFAGDQGAMIAWQGVLEFSAGKVHDPESVDILPYERTDDVDVFWKK
jgi:N6-L-threonylcarbamoyladenine synthase